MWNEPEYGTGDVSAFLRANEARYTADGLPLPEVHRAHREIHAWAQWWPYWMERSCWFEERASHAGTTRPTRASMLVYASLCAHLAQYLHFHDEDARTRALRQKIATYRRALTVMDPPGERLEVPFDGAVLPAILRRRRDGAGPAPCVVYVGGLDAHKEDAHAFVELCLDRGLSVLAFDGPGQGEARMEGITLDHVGHLGISAAIDVLSGLPGVDQGRIGVIGRSLGGYLAPRAAADDPRIAALCVWGAMVDLEVLPDLPLATQAGFRHVTGADSAEDAAARLRFVQLRGVAERIACPTLVVHGAEDALTPVEHAQTLAAEVGERCELRVLPGSGHCNHDVAHVVRPEMADWLAATLS